MDRGWSGDGRKSLLRVAAKEEGEQGVSVLVRAHA